MQRGDEQRARLCAREGDDAVRALFCADPPPSIGSLIELQTAFHLDSGRLGGVQGLAVGAHSTALSARSVSSINPRVIAVRLESPPVELFALSYARGEQFIELAVRDRADKELRFYLAAFRQACNASEAGCVPGDLLTPAVESDWTELTLYDEEDLKNTQLDCATCHQPDGPGTPKLLRMQELQSPWTHWFWRSSKGGLALIADYTAAKGDEVLAGMTSEQLQGCHPANLSQLAIFSGSYRQPNEFLSELIEDEVLASSAARGGAQPEDNSVPGDSPTWRLAYEAARRGEAIPVPYHDVKVTEPSKLARMTEAYQAFRRGELDRAQLPDIRDVFPDDPTRLAEMGTMTEPGLDGAGVLLQACSQCHNPRLDPNLSRARFRADLVGMSREEKQLAIERLKLPEAQLGAMPPPRLRRLSAEARQRAIEALQR
jgi:mono/diheme cytochrome c family protein